MTNKFFDLLPIQHQTSVNRNFFESTVEQLFSKSNVESVQGFIGTPRDITSNTVFIEQPAPNREYYSFDPVVTTVDAVTGKPNNYTFYEDFLYDLSYKLCVMTLCPYVPSAVFASTSWKLLMNE